MDNDSINTDVANFIHFLETATRDQLDLEIVKVAMQATNYSQSMDKRRIYKNIIALLRKQRREFD